jgi:hypothetical protein
MPAIVKANHQHFCDMVEGFRASQSVQDIKLTELESELNDFFRAYQKSLNDIKTIIIEYGEKQKEIRHRMKQLHRNESSGKRKNKRLSGYKVPG